MMLRQLIDTVYCFPRNARRNRTCVYIDPGLGYRPSATAHAPAACRGGWGEAVEPTAIAVGCRDIAPHGACRAKTDRVFGECLKYYLTADTQRTKSHNLTDLYLSTFFRKRHTDGRKRLDVYRINIF